MCVVSFIKFVITSCHRHEETFFVDLVRLSLRVQSTLLVIYVFLLCSWTFTAIHMRKQKKCFAWCCNSCTQYLSQDVSSFKYSPFSYDLISCLRSWGEKNFWLVVSFWFHFKGYHCANLTSHQHDFRLFHCYRLPQSMRDIQQNGSKQSTGIC